MLHKALKGCTEPLTPPCPQYVPEAPSSHSPLTLPTPRYAPSLQDPARFMGRGRVGGGTIQGGGDGAGVCGVWSGWMYPQSPALSPARMSPQYRSSPHCRPLARPRSGPQRLSAMPSCPGSPFYLLSTLPAQEGGEEPGRSWDCALATTACLWGQQQGRHCPHQ